MLAPGSALHRKSTQVMSVNSSSVVSLRMYFCFVIYFFCLDAKEVTRKNQGQHDRSAHLSGPAPHIAFLFLFWSVWC